jgi:hypothetical protein
VPQIVAEVARKLLADVTYMPTAEIARYAGVVRRLAADRRMEQVWIELRRREGGAARHGGYAHRPRREILAAHDQIGWLSPLTEALAGEERLQAHAAAVLFIEVARFCLWDRQIPFGPFARARAEAEGQAAELRDLADKIDEDAERLAVVGLAHHAPQLRQAAADCRSLASLRQPDPSDQYIVGRHSQRIGDHWVRGFLITISGLCSSLFGKQMPGVVAILCNVTFDRSDMTASKVRGALRHLPGVKDARRGR